MEQEVLVEPLPEDIPATGSTKLGNAGHQLILYMNSPLLLPTKGACHLQVAPDNGQDTTGDTTADSTLQQSSTATTADLRVLRMQC